MHVHVLPLPLEFAVVSYWQCHWCERFIVHADDHLTTMLCISFKEWVLRHFMLLIARLCN